MLNIIKLIDRVLPLWEVIVVGFALFAIVLVLVLWWAFGYNLIVIPEPTASVMKPAMLLLPLV
jgi:hypothetical protein